MPHLVGVYPEQLLRQQALLESVVIIQACLCAPADMECAEYVCFAPGKHFAQLRPVVHVFVFHLLNRRACDDQSVKALVPQFVESIIELLQMGHGRILGLVGAHPHKCDVDLQRRVGKHSQELELCLFLLGHQIQNAQLKRTDILMGSPVFVYDEQILILEYFLYRQIILYFDRHDW